MSTESTEAAKQGGMKKALLVAVVLLIAAAGAWFTMFKPAEEDGHEEPVPGEVLTLDPVYVNLAGGGYLKIGIALQFTAEAGGGGHGGSAPNGAHALDLIIDEFSQASPADVIGRRAKMKHALEERIIDAYHHEVMGIYYTSYVTQ